MNALSATPFALLFLVASLLSWQVLRQRSAGMLVDRADAIIANTTRIMKRLIDLETGFRGYLLSGQAVYLEPYEQAAGAVEAEAQTLDRMMQGRPEQQARLHDLQAATKDWLAYARAIIQKRETDPHFAAPYADAEGKQRMDAMRGKVEEILAAEQDSRDSFHRRHDRELSITVAGVYALLIVAAAFIAWYSRRQATWIRGSYARNLERTRREGEQYRAIFDGVKDYGMALLDPGGKVQTWNPAAEKLTGYLAQEMIGKSIEALYEPDATPGLANAFDQAREHGRYETEGFRLRKDGTKWWADFAFTSLRDVRGEVRGFSTIFRDYTRRRQLEEERAYLVKNLEQGIRSRDDFLALASHELRTPITALSLRLQHVRREADRQTDGSAQQIVLPRAAFESLRRQTQRLSRLVESMLDTVRIHSGALTMNFAVSDLSRIARQVVDDHREHFAGSGCPIEEQIEPSVEANFDELRIEQVMTNLLSNALRYGCKGAVRVELKRQAKSASFLVRDEGPGIAAEHHGRIFERYGRVDATSATGGLGIGLFVSREIVEAHGGTLRVESEPGRGATFSFELPLPA